MENIGNVLLSTNLPVLSELEDTLIQHHDIGITRRYPLGTLTSDSGLLVNYLAPVEDNLFYLYLAKDWFEMKV